MITSQRSYSHPYGSAVRYFILAITAILLSSLLFAGRLEAAVVRIDVQLTCKLNCDSVSLSANEQAFGSITIDATGYEPGDRLDQFEAPNRLVSFKFDIGDAQITNESLSSIFFVAEFGSVITKFRELTFFVSEAEFPVPGDTLNFDYVDDDGQVLANFSKDGNCFPSPLIAGLCDGTTLYQPIVSFDQLSVSVTGTIVSPVPVPAAVWLFGSGILALIGLGVNRRQK